MQLNTQQLTILSEMGVPVWQLRTAEPITEQSADAQPASNEIAAELLTRNWLVMVDDIDRPEKRSLLDNMLKAISVEPDNVTVVSSNQYQQLANIPELNRVLLVLGNKAAQQVVGSQQPLENYRGSIQQAHVDAVICFDLDDLLANPQKKAQAWQDLLLAKSHFEQQASHA